MEVFTKKRIVQKIIIVIIFIMSFNFIIPNVSFADQFGSGVEGVLFEPIKDLLLGITDVIVWIMNKTIYGMDESFLDMYYKKSDLIDTSYNVGLIIMYINIMENKGQFQEVLFGSDEITSNKLAKHVKLPMFLISPEEIFKGEIPLLDVNFFNPKDNKTEKICKTTISKGEEIGEPRKVENKNYQGKTNIGALDKWLEENGYNIDFIEKTLKSLVDEDKNTQSTVIPNEGTMFWKHYEAKCSGYDENNFYEIEIKLKECWFNSGVNDTSVESGTIRTYERIEKETPIDEAEIVLTSSANQLQPIISKWYYALRNFAIVMLLSILVYMGIRIIISSSSENRAKYKSHLLDWLIAMCILFAMHYIMSFAVTFTEKITESVASMNPTYKYIIKNSTSNNKRKLEDYYYTNGEKVLGYGGLAVKVKLSEDSIAWPTNLMGKARLDLQMESNEYSNDQKLMKNFSLTVIYMGLVMYTVLFLFRYLKRLLMLTFLTIIAPLMAMTYPLDKMHDNKSQAFNMWLKEYIFNLLIQPVHLILYTVLIGTALEFAANNILYSLVAFGFMLQAEKLMKKLFGFGVASTVSNTSAALGGALAMKGIDMISKKLGGKKGGKKEIDKKTPQQNRKPTRNLNDLMNSVLGQSAGTLESTSRANEHSKEDSMDSSSNLNNESDENKDSQDNNLQANLGQEVSKQAEFIAEEQKKSRERIASSNLRTISNKVGSSQLGKHAKYILPKVAKGLAKGALKAGLMGAGATVGLTAGLVSDDFSNVTKFGLAGAGAGLLAGKGIPNKLSSMKKGIGDAYEKEYKATHTKAEINQRLDKKALEDKERIKKYQEEFGVDKQGAQNIMREIAQQYRDYGVTDDDMIIKAIKEEGINDAEKIMVAKMASQVGGDEEKYKNLKEGLEDRGIDQAIANKYLQIIRGFNNWV